RIGGKTAALFANATEGGAVLGGCDEAWVDALRSYGYNIGMAFQIIDDLLDFIGDEVEMGKPVGSDLREGTITLPALLLLERYPRDNPIKKFFTARRARDQHLQDAIEMVRGSEVVPLTRQMAKGFVERAVDAIAMLPASDTKQCLADIGDYVLDRRS
ncbi:MAG: polyprenyl synthetase family protein, partial [Dehalococcoidia bacterium]